MSGDFDNQAYADIHGYPNPDSVVALQSVARLEAEEERDQYDALADAVDEIVAIGPGDILVFLPTEQEIRQAAKRPLNLINRNAAGLPGS